MKAYMYGFIMTIQFFSVLPIHKEVPMTDKNIERAVRVFPLFGTLIGLVYSGIPYVLLQWTPLTPLAAAFAVWTVMIVLTGGIHLDGWMDASDAFFSYQDKERRLAIMKDSRVGAFGVLSVIVLLGAKFLFIYEILLHAEKTIYLLILLIPVFSRMTMGLMLVLVPSAKNAGLGHMFQRACSPRTFSGYAVYFTLLGLAVWMLDVHAVVMAVLLLITCFPLFWFMKKKAVKWFGGITGDVIGAATEGTEAFLWMLVWLLHYYVTG